MTSLEKAINLGYLFLTLKPQKKHINTCTTFFCIFWYVSIYSEDYFWPPYMYPKLSPFNGYRWCPLGKLSHMGLEQLYFAYLSTYKIFSCWLSNILIWCRHAFASCISPVSVLRCSKKLHIQSYLEMLWSETGYFGLLGNNIILFIILLYLIKV